MQSCGDARVESPRRVSYKGTMFRLAHVSDVHLGPLPDVTYRDLASKRMVGYVNWQRNRRHIMQDGVLGSITRHQGGRRRPSRRHRRPRQPGARRRDRAGEALAGDAGPAGGRFRRSGKPRRLCAGRFRQGLPLMGRLDDRRRPCPRRPTATPFPICGSGARWR